MRWLAALLALVPSTNSAAGEWPPLPKSGFVSGRLATEADLKRGDAIFLSLVDGKPSGSPARIHVPQFAHLIEENGARRPVVVIQAETNEQGTVFGVKDVRGNEYVATEAEVILLGSSHP
ncbi:hypothetical protein [Caulobacter sp. SSI4214]|uniref:hypothetical protein n=1 Tax=Caulobacter sp. SSI4214 TaxID=2575739 RepID=UPI0019D61BB4|nr:hypothetical protein [Caulobacter sp. SSI4214]